MKIKIVVMSIIIIFVLFFCLIFIKKENTIENNNNEDTKSKKIVCTTMLIKDAIEQLVDEKFEVISLMGPGVDPHTYKVKPSDVHHMLHADVILYNGLHLEGKMIEIFESISKEKKVICIADGLSKNELISAGYEHMYDPHIWHDHVLWRKVIFYIADQLGQVFSEDKKVIEQKKKDYEKQLDMLENYIQKLLLKIPVSERILITAHDAFHYFGKRYDFKVHALQGLSTESDIGIKDIEMLVDLILQYKVHAIFLESCIPPRNIMSLQESVLSRGRKIIIGGELFSDSLSEKEAGAGTYIEMMQYNMRTIIDALLIIPD